MVRGTTPTFKLVLNDENVDLTSATNVYVTFCQNGINLTKTGDDIEVLEKEVDVYLNQQETLNFHSNIVEIQVNWTYDDGKRACSNIAKILVGRNLLNEVIE